jgi:hypothetical protein
MQVVYAFHREIILNTVSGPSDRHICKTYEEAVATFASYCREQWMQDIEGAPQSVVDCMGLPPDDDRSVIARWTFVNPNITWVLHESAFLTFNASELMTVEEAEKAWEKHVARIRGECAEHEAQVREILARLSERDNPEHSVA